MKNSKTFVRVVALVLALVMIVPFFVSCSDKKKKGSGDDTSKDTKVNTLTGEVGADLMGSFAITLWSKEPYMFGLDLAYTDSELKRAETFGEFETLLEEGMTIEHLYLVLKEHAKTYNKSLKKITFTIEANQDVDLYLNACLDYRHEEKKGYKNEETSGKSVSLKANQPTELELIFDMEDALEGDGKLYVSFQQDKSGEVLTDTWDEWHLTKYKITDFKVIMK